MPLNFDYSHYDPESKSQLQFVHIKAAIEALERNQNELNRKVLDSHEVLDKRLVELESARKVQITLNARFLALENNDIKEPPKVNDFWAIFK